MTTTTPTRADSDVRCRCGALLAVRTAGTYAIKHRGKEIVCVGLVSVKCDRCGEVLSLIELKAREENGTTG